MNYRIEFEQEEDGRWIADIPELPGVMAYGATKQQAQSKVQAIALRVIADTLERDQATLDGLLLAPLDRSALYLAKVAATVAFMALVEIVALPILTFIGR